MRAAKKNKFNRWKLSRQQISREIIDQQFYLKQSISNVKKRAPGQIQAEDLCRSRHILYLQAKLAVNALKFDSLCTKIQVILINKLLIRKKSIIQFDNAC